MKMGLVIFLVGLSIIAIYGCVKTVIYQVKSGLFFRKDMNDQRD